MVSRSLFSAAALAALLAAALGAGEPGGAGVIHPRDRVRILVQGAENLSLTVQVPEAGHVMYPFMERLTLAGKRPEEVAADVREGLRKAGHLTGANVSVFIEQFALRTIYIVGAVNTPRSVQFPRTEVLTVSQAVAAAGGFKPEADWRDVRVFRRHGGLQVLHVDMETVLEKGQPAQDLELADGDLVFAGAADMVFVFGHVNSPGAYRLPPGVPATLSRYVSVAGGFTRFARSNRVRLIRRDAAGDEERVRVVDMRQIIELGKVEEDLGVKPGDIIFVPESLF